VSTKERKRRQQHAYNTELADLICEWIAVDGLAVREICRDAAMPARSTVFVWLRQRPDFRKEYTSAKWLQCQCLADEMVDIADDRANDWIERQGPDGEKVRVSDDENFRRRKQQIGALQWRISKLKPKRYSWWPTTEAHDGLGFPITTLDAFTLNAAIFIKLDLEGCTAWSALLTWGLRLSPRHAPDQALMRPSCEIDMQQFWRRALDRLTRAHVGQMSLPSAVIHKRHGYP
jgi:hypothetical protein